MSLNKPQYLGRLCKRGHDHAGTGHSLRYATGHTCVTCTSERDRGRPRKGRPDRAKKRLYEVRYQSKPETKAKRRAQVARRRQMGTEQAYQKAWMQRNPNYMTQWLSEHPGYAKLWREQHPEAWRALQCAGRQRRRARLAGVPQVPYSGDQIVALLLAYGQRCAYCGDGATAMDHVVPITLGGHDALYNLVPACRRCNSSKRNQTMEAWYSRQPFFALERLEFMANQHAAAGLPRLGAMP